MVVHEELKNRRLPNRVDHSVSLPVTSATMLRLSQIVRRQGVASFPLLKCSIRGRENIVENREERRWVTRATVESLLRDYKVVNQEGVCRCLFLTILHCDQGGKVDSPSSQAQREIEILLSQAEVKSKQDLIEFFDRTRKLLATHETLLQKHHLMPLLDRVGRFGDALRAPRTRVGALCLLHSLVAMRTSAELVPSVLDIVSYSCWARLQVMQFSRDIQDHVYLSPVAARR